MRLLVTGGAGFIGSNFVRYILDRYPRYHVVNLDKLTYAGNRNNLKDLAQSPRHRFIKGDICDRPLVFRLASRVDAIINFAAETHVDRSIREAAPFLRTNFEGTGTLLEAAHRHRHARYLQISTDEVYGSIARGRAGEEAPLRPSNPYAASKAGADLLVLAYWSTHRLPALISRCCNNYGPHQYPEKLIPLFITNALMGLPLPLYGDGLHRRDWIHVRDHCRAVDLLLHHGSPGNVYNVGGSGERTNLAVARRIAAQMRSSSPIEHVTDRPGHDRRYAMRDGKARAIGYRPAVSFVDGVAETVEWYRTHRAWWERIRGGAFRRYYRRQYDRSAARSGLNGRAPARPSAGVRRGA
ncbi:MAG: dTDP-glucose 4,6-dehydratase [Nitrospirota bacterium]